jgi:hypothetical protein
VTVPDEVTVDAAAELLKAAILLADLGGAIPIPCLETMPPDIRTRLYASSYQDAFDRLPEDIRESARVIALADPMIQEALRIDARARRGRP